MSKTKRIQSRGKPGFSKIFQEFNKGESVAVIKEPSVGSKFPFRLQGLTGVVIGKRGKSYMIEIKTQNKKKKFLIEPVHLKRIKQ